jgi:hypothetical protein
MPTRMAVFSILLFPAGRGAQFIMSANALSTTPTIAHNIPWLVEMVRCYYGRILEVNNNCFGFVSFFAKGLYPF